MAQGALSYARDGFRMVSGYRDVKASGIRLRVTDVGSGPCLLLLHTLFVDRTCWHRVVEELASSFRVIAPDLPGCGESEKPGTGRFSYSVAAMTDVVTALYAGLGLGPACLVGHGLGGAIAIDLANRFPELVSRQMLLDTWCYPTRPDPTLRVANVPIVGSVVFKQLFGRGALKAHFRDRLTAGGEPLSAGRFEHYYTQFNAPSARNSALAIMRHTRDLRYTRAALSRVTVPSLVVWGRNDALCSPSEGKEVARQIRGCGFELLEAGHLVPEQRPNELVEVIAKFGTSQRAVG